MSKRNIPELEATMQYILDHPEAHDQASWCGSAQCFAGHVGARNGLITTVNVNEMIYREDRMTRWASPWDRVAITPDGRYTTVREFARNTLGLGDLEADILFHSENDIDTLQLVVKALVNGEKVHSLDALLPERD